MSVTMPEAGPSALLTQLLAELDSLLRKNSKQISWLRSLARAGRRAAEKQEAWHLDPDDLYDVIEETIGRDLGDLSPPQDRARMAFVIGMLDAWHSFANRAAMDDQGGQMLPPAAAEAEAALESRRCYNDNDPARFGRLIPAVCPGEPGLLSAPADRPRPLAGVYQDYVAACPTGTHTPLPFHYPASATLLLQNTVWLPVTVPRADPGRAARPQTTIKAGYLLVGAAEPLDLIAPVSRVQDGPPSPRIAVAPLAETRDCITLHVVDHGRRYLVGPNFSITRVKAAISAAFAAEAAILLLPEMTIHTEWLQDLADWVKTCRKRHGKSPLNYVLLGMTTPPRDGNIDGENFLAVIAANGSIVTVTATGDYACQHKINPWDLNAKDKRRFGFDRGRPPAEDLAAIVCEAIKPAETAYVVDLVNYGRVIIFICASLAHDEPSDWLIQHARPNWVYAPVMDSSACYQGRVSPLEKWTVTRAVRAACLSRAKIIVANSMALQDMENVEGAIPTDPHGTRKEYSFPANRAPGIAFMVDGSGVALKHTVLTAPIPTSTDDSDPILRMTRWNDGWSDLPKVI